MEATQIYSDNILISAYCGENERPDAFAVQDWVSETPPVKGRPGL